MEEARQAAARALVVVAREAAVVAIRGSHSVVAMAQVGSA